MVRYDLYERTRVKQVVSGLDGVMGSKKRFTRKERLFKIRRKLKISVTEAGGVVYRFTYGTLGLFTTAN